MHPSSRRSLASAPRSSRIDALTFVVLAAACLPRVGAAAPTPTLAPVVIDGLFEDWSEVLTNPANVTPDGDGSTIPCASSRDRDCPVAGAGLDLSRFAWTWDDAALHLFVETHGPFDGSSSQTFFVSVDAERDGVLSDGAAVISLDVSLQPPTVRVRAYRPADAVLGDPLVDGLGLADGHDLPGDVRGGPWDTPAGIAPSADLLRHEASVAWSTLGLPPGSAFDFHVASSAGTVMANVTDNLGAPLGGVGTTAFRRIAVEPDRSFSSAPGTTIMLPHVVRNEGNLAERFRLRATSTSGQDLRFYADLDGDGDGDVHLGTDAGGDGLMFLPGDVLTPAGDTDGDSVLDTGILEPAQELALVIEELPPPSATGLVERVELVAWSASDAALQDGAVDRITLGRVGLVSDSRLLAAPGDAAWFSHVLSNHSGAALQVSLVTVGAKGWPVALFRDADGDGEPFDATPIPDLDGDGRADVALANDESFAVLARVAVPIAAAPGEGEIVFLRAVVDGAIEAVVRDGVTVAPPLSLQPDHLLSAGDPRYGAAGGSAYFHHVLINSAGMADTVEIAAASDRGWPVRLLADPDGDGLPHDAQALAGATALLARNGGRLALFARVDIPPGIAVGESSRITVTATSLSGGGATATALDDAVVAIVRAYSDAAHVLNISRTSPCSTIHVRADNLPPSRTDARFAWREPSGRVVRLAEVATDAAGSCADAMTLQPGEAGEGWSVDVQLLEGSNYVTQDRARFDVVNALQASNLSTLRATHDVADASFHASVRVSRTGTEPVPADPTLRWVVLSPDGTRFLSPTGEFLPYTGAEASGLEPLELQPGETRLAFLSVSGVRWPGPGSYGLEAWLPDSCGSALPSARTAFAVTDDADADGVTAEDELAAGTDPFDADSDDDGLRDGEDGMSDGDGDGVIDALDCDSDADGLPDGLESGVTGAGPGTDPASSCFAPDSDPASRTDPDVRDTDNGGVADGIEDADGNGRVDAGERNPGDPSDDHDGCSTAVPPEVGGLRAARVATSVELRWDAIPVDGCTTYALLSGSVPTALAPTLQGLVSTSCVDTRSSSGDVYYLVQAVSSLAGPGPVGP